jgi:hypothetical protein
MTFWFDTPVCVAAVRARNYSKTPARGAREVELRLDGSLVHRGELPPAAAAAAANAAAANAAANAAAAVAPWRAILFSADSAVVAAYGGECARPGAEVDVGLWNDGREVRRKRAPPRAINVDTGSIFEDGFAEVRPLTGRPSLRT